MVCEFFNRKLRVCSVSNLNNSYHISFLLYFTNYQKIVINLFLIKKIILNILFSLTCC